MTFQLKCLTALLLTLIQIHTVSAQQQAFKGTPIATKDLLAVAYIDVKAVDIEACLNWAVDQEIVPADVAGDMQPMVGMAQALLKQATSAGTDQILALIQRKDLMDPQYLLFVATISDGHDVNKTLKSLKRILALAPIPDFKMEVWNDVIIGGPAKQIADFKAEPKLESLQIAPADDEHDAGLTIVANADARRAIRELFPSLEAPFDKVTGKLIAENVIAASVSIKLPEDVDGKIVVHTTDAESAEILAAAAVAGKEMLLAKGGEYTAMAPAIGVAAVSQMEPKVAGTDLVIDLQPLLSDKVKLMELLEPIRAGSRKNQRSNDLRQLILAMLNYELANKTLPPYANFDENGKPLLSWRVLILPFLDQLELYNQFKLDEPWDSPHNIKLVEKMPDVFADPSFELKELSAAGRTRMVVPRSEATIFHGQEGTAFKQITDGSSNTVAIVNVVPDRAVIWTKPADWEVDLENPIDGLFDDKNKEAAFSRADGSTGIFQADGAVGRIKAMLTRAGGEIIP